MRVDNDKPILKNDEDFLGFNKWAKKLAKVAINENSPTCIGIFGEWGSGKTSLMNLIKEEIGELDKDEKGKEMGKYLAVDFNSWKFESSENLLESLLSKVATDLEPDEDGVNSFFDTALRYSVAALKNFKFNAKIKIPAVSEAGVSLSITDIINGYKSEDAKTINQVIHKYTDSHFELFNNYNLISKFLEQSFAAGTVRITKVFVFLDDLDRCHPDIAVNLLDQIKIILDQPNFVFFIGVSKQIITKYLKHRYQKDYGIERFDGEEYLNKIIPLPFNIPLPNKKAVEGLIRKRGGEELEDSLLNIIRIASKHKPRKAMRLLNIHSVLDLIIEKSEAGSKVGINHYMIWAALDLHEGWRDNIKFFIRMGNIRILGFFEELIKGNLEGTKEKKEGVEKNEYYSTIEKTIESDSFLSELINAGSYFEEIIATDEAGKGIRSQLSYYDVNIQEGQSPEDKKKEKEVESSLGKYDYDLKIYNFVIESDEGEGTGWVEELGDLLEKEEKKIIIEETPKQQGYFERKDYMNDRLKPISPVYIYLLPNIAKMDKKRQQRIKDHIKTLKEYGIKAIIFSIFSPSSVKNETSANKGFGIVYEGFDAKATLELLTKELKI